MISTDAKIIAAKLNKLRGHGYVYLASPYSKLAEDIGLDEAARLVSVAAATLVKEGVAVFSPIAHGHAVACAGELDKLDGSMWMKQCHPMVREASACAVLMLDGWHDSTGVKEEVQLFNLLGKPVIFVNPSDLIPIELNPVFA